jgi:hypothetical protein
MSEVKRPLTLKWILGKQDRRVWNGTHMAGCCEHGNEPSGSIRGGDNFLLAEHSISFSRRTLLHGVRR